VGFFDFLKPVKKEANQVFSFLSNNSVGKTVTNVAGRVLGAPGQVASTFVTNPAARKEGISAAQGFAKVPETVGRSFGQEQAAVLSRVPVINRVADFGSIASNLGESAPNTGLRKAVYGEGSIKSYQNRYSGATSDLQAKGLGKAAAPLALLGTGINIAGDVTGGGAEKKAGEEFITNLAKSTAESEVKKILAKKFAPDVVDRIAPAITKATDRNVITNIIRKETDVSPALTRVAPDVTSTPVGGEVSAVGKGSGIPISDVRAVPQPTAAQVVEENPFTKVSDALKGQTAGPGQSPVAGVKSLQQKQSDIYTAGRQSRLSAAQEASVGKTGEHALNARLAQYQGKFDKVDTANLVQHVQSVIDEPTYAKTVDNFLNSPNLRPYEQTTAANAWRNFYRDGTLPRPHELRLFEKAAGTDFANTVKTTAIDSMSTSQKLKHYATQILGLPKAIMASFDISGGGRQGAFLGTRYGGAWLDGEKATAKSFISKAEAEKYTKYLQDGTPETARFNDYIDRMKLDLASTGTMEEAFPTSIAEKIPIVNNSDRAYTIGLSVQRRSTAEKILATLEENGFKVGQSNFLGFKHGGEKVKDLAQLTDEQLQSLGKYINTATGRGDLGKFLNKHATSLQSAFFSPRLWKSRLDLLNPVFYAKLDGPAQKLAVQNAGSFAAVAAAVLGIAAAAGAVIETDPRSSDFLKIKVGDTRYDILGGFQQNLVFAWRQLSGEKKSSLTGKITDLKSGKPFQADRLSVLGDLIQNKENPLLGEFQKQLSGKDKAGQPLTAASRATSVGNLFVPLSIQDTYKTVKNTGDIVKGVAKSIPGFVGTGVGTYGVKDQQLTGKNKEYVDKLKSSGADQKQIQASTEFFQVNKTGPDRISYGDRIKKALKSGDTQKAVELAKEFNKKYADTFSEWAKKYPEYKNDKALLKEYQSNKITEESLTRWYKSQQ